MPILSNREKSGISQIWLEKNVYIEKIDKIWSVPANYIDIFERNRYS